MLVPVDESKPMLEQLHFSSDEERILHDEQLERAGLHDELERRCQEQLATQQHLFSVLIEQIDELLAYSGTRGTYDEDIGETLAHKINCMAALAKCNTGKMLQQS